MAYGGPHFQNRPECVEPNAALRKGANAFFGVAQHENDADQLQEAIVAFLARHLGEKRMNRVAVNIGANDGKTQDPLYNLFFNRNWRGLAVEANPPDFDLLKKNLAGKNVRMVLGTITPANIVRLLSEADVPTDVDIFKIDIDSFDISVLFELLRSGFRPKLINMEINEKIPPPVFLSLNYAREWTWKGDHLYGLSIAYAAHVLGEFGYRPVNLNWNNLLLVDADNFCEPFKGLEFDISTLYDTGYAHRPGTAWSVLCSQLIIFVAHRKDALFLQRQR